MGHLYGRGSSPDIGVVALLEEGVCTGVAGADRVDCENGLFSMMSAVAEDGEGGVTFSFSNCRPLTLPRQGTFANLQTVSGRGAN